MKKCAVLFFLFLVSSASAQMSPSSVQEGPSASFYRFSAKLPFGNITYPVEGWGGIGLGFVPSSKAIYRSSGFSGYARQIAGGLINGQFKAFTDGMSYPGTPAIREADPRVGVYVLRSTDTVFSESWQSWKDAVTLGASYYDGNGDGIYNPVDRNRNGKWDSDEDRPDILGDITAWCAYYWPPYTSLPIGVEVKQTIFAWKNSQSVPFNNTMFFRYRFINTGTAADIIDSLYVSNTYDFDIGNQADDLAGCDTIAHSAYVYQKLPDDEWGAALPVYSLQLLQGPRQYFPGVTYIDVNSNGVFDAGIDTPKDTAVNNMGPLMGRAFYPGARNAGMTSFTNKSMAQLPLREPPSPWEMYSIVFRGIVVSQESMSPCTYTEGRVEENVPCASINPRYYFSGDPAAPSGWVNTFGTEQQIYLNTGPFRLEKNKPVDIVYALVVGHGNSWTQSLELSRQYWAGMREFYGDNFGPDLPMNVNSPAEYSYSLSQNFPNPFNPSTIIRYSLRTPPREFAWDKAGMRRVTLKVFDILGREVAELVNTSQREGEYEVEFNPARMGLPSGIYIYELHAGTFNEKRKMAFVK